MIIVTRRSMLTGKIRHIPMDVTVEQLKDWRAGTYIQDAMPHLSASEREFLMTGITDDEWEETFSEEKSENNGG